MNPARLLAACLAAVVAFAVATAVWAQSPPTRLRGSIAAIDGKTATIATREGSSVKVNLADNWVVMLVSPVTMADIKENSFVGIASMKGPDGTLNALEVLVFPEAARGSGEGHYPWDLQPDSVMTNATVGTITQAPQGNVIKVSYKGTESEYTVDPTTPIFANATGDRSLLVPGAAVFVIASKHDDGKLTSARLYVEKDGIKPPM